MTGKGLHLVEGDESLGKLLQKCPARNLALQALEPESHHGIGIDVTPRFKGVDQVHAPLIPTWRALSAASVLTINPKLAKSNNLGLDQLVRSVLKSPL